MSWELETTTVQKAQKDYYCQASEWISQAWPLVDYFNAEEIKVIEKAKSENWQILKGTIYTKTKGLWEGEFSTFRARIDLDEICFNHDLYPDY